MLKLAGYIRLMRPINCLMMGVAVVIGAALANPNLLSGFEKNLIYGFMTGFFLTATSMTLNDYYDREIDAINVPNRPIPSGAIKPREALSFAFILTTVGFFAAFLTSVLCFIVAIVACIFFFAYTTVGKRSGLPGNFLVSACVAIPFVYGSILAVGTIKLESAFFILCVFFSNTGREITKGIADVEGDKVKNVKTIAVHYGKKKAAISASMFYISATLLSPLPWLLELVSPLFLPFVAITDVGLIAASVMLLKDYSRENALKIKKIVLLWFVFGLLAFLIGVST